MLVCIPTNTAMNSTIPDSNRPDQTWSRIPVLPEHDAEDHPIRDISLSTPVMDSDQYHLISSDIVLNSLKPAFFRDAASFSLEKGRDNQKANLVCKRGI
jgi:hypothetical protein